MLCIAGRVFIALRARARSLSLTLRTHRLLTQPPSPHARVLCRVKRVCVCVTIPYPLSSRLWPLESCGPSLGPAVFRSAFVPFQTQCRRPSD